MRVRAILAAVLAWAGFAGAAPAAVDLPAPGELVQARLVAESASLAPGKTLWVALHLTVKPGWHVYWRNPGDSGLPTEIAWHLPPGFSAGAIDWPAPQRFVVGGLANYGYTGTADLLVPIAVPAALPGGPLTLRAEASWLVCADICIPGGAKLALDLPPGTGAPDPDAAALFAAARRRLPQPAPFAAQFSAAGRDYRLFLPGVDGGSRIEFFPYDGNLIDHAAEPRIEPSAGGVTLVLAKSAAATKAPARLDGVVEIGDAAYALSAVPGAAPAAPAAAFPLAWWQALALAFAGGVVLNLMPCVFPILSLKLLSLAGLAQRRDAHRDGLAYGAGVVVSFAALGFILLALRAGGDAVGWGFQLQSPLVVALLAYLMLAMALSLSGVAEFGYGLAGAGSRFTGLGGTAGAFAAGVLAAVVATPCTAPFMGAALGFAVVAPAPLALAVFAVLGAGMAAPLTAASFVPAVVRHLPRPGRWMATAKQVLAFPLYATVAWLVWVLLQEVEPASALAVLFGLVLVGFAVWLYGASRAAAPLGRRLAGGLAAAGLIAAILLAANAGPGAGASRAAQAGLPYQPFSSARLAALEAEKRPVFVNLTASWCLTCLVNERTALDREAVREAFARRGIVALKGDWTRQNPEITALLQSFGRSGVPLYLLYDGKGGTVVLPPLLTEATVLDAVAKL